MANQHVVYDGESRVAPLSDLERMAAMEIEINRLTRELQSARDALKVVDDALLMLEPTMPHGWSKSAEFAIKAARGRRGGEG